MRPYSQKPNCPYTQAGVIDRIPEASSLTRLRAGARKERLGADSGNREGRGFQHLPAGTEKVHLMNGKTMRGC